MRFKLKIVINYQNYPKHKKKLEQPRAIDTLILFWLSLFILFSTFCTFSLISTNRIQTLMQFKRFYIFMNYFHLNRIAIHKINPFIHDYFTEKKTREKKLRNTENSAVKWITFHFNWCYCCSIDDHYMWTLEICMCASYTVPIMLRSNTTWPIIVWSSECRKYN